MHVAADGRHIYFPGGRRKLQGADNPWGIEPTLEPSSQFFGLWLANGPPPSLQLTQFALWARALHFFHPAARIYLFSMSGPGALPDDAGAGLVTHVRLLSVGEVLDNSPAAPIKPLVESLVRLTPNAAAKQRAGYPQLSDLLRLAMLYRWGGSWIDVDDLCVRPVPPAINVIGVIEHPHRRRDASYFGHRFKTLIPAERVSPSPPARATG